MQVDELKAPIVGDRENWLWVATEPVSKIIPAIHIGKRRTEDAMLFVHHLIICLAPGCVLAFTSGGMRQYFYAMTAHFGDWHWPKSLRSWVVSGRLLYGQMVKRRGKKKNEGKPFILTRMKAGKRCDLVKRLRSVGLSGTIQTAVIERFTPTIRHGIVALARRTWSKVCSKEALHLHVQWWRTYYHFSREHESLNERILGRRRYRKRTPAMARASPTASGLSVIFSTDRSSYLKEVSAKIIAHRLAAGLL